MKLLRKILGGISLTAAMFAFQACYGTGEYYDDGPLKGVSFRVTEAKDGLPVSDIKVESRWEEWEDGELDAFSSWNVQGYTDSAGILSVETHIWCETLRFRFSDIDSIYAVADTVASLNFDTIDIVLRRADR